MNTSDVIANHYVCSECVYISQHFGICQTDDCIMQNQPLIECHCEDGKHAGTKIDSTKDDTDNDIAPGNQQVTTLDLDD
jgi:hypothetical protein